MPVVGLTDLVDGAVMSWADFSANFALIRSYVNAVPLADIAAQGISREHIVSPSRQPSPIGGQASGFGAEYAREFGAESPYFETDWGPLADRVSIAVDASDNETDRKWITPIGATFWSPGGDVVAILTCNVHVRCGNLIQYPNAGAGEAIGGYVELVTVDRATGIPIIQTETRRHIYPRALAFTPGPMVSAIEMMASFSVNEGDHDIYLQFVRDQTINDGDFPEVDFSDIVFSVEVI